MVYVIPLKDHACESGTLKKEKRYEPKGYIIFSTK
jgi:hypothetical protein